VVVGQRSVVEKVHEETVICDEHSRDERIWELIDGHRVIIEP